MGLGLRNPTQGKKHKEERKTGRKDEEKGKNERKEEEKWKKKWREKKKKEKKRKVAEQVIHQEDGGYPPGCMIRTAVKTGQQVVSFHGETRHFCPRDLKSCKQVYMLAEQVAWLYKKKNKRAA